LNLTFLNAAFLLGALAALLPLLIHLFSRRRVETVDFSSLRFLRELERRKIRRVRVRQILLLIVRSLIILCVAVALARPTLKGALGGEGGHARTSMAVVIDDSASMTRSSLDGAAGLRLFEEASAVAGEIAGLLDEGDQAFLITAGSPSRSLLPGGTFSRSTLEETIAGVTPGAAGTDYSAAVETALRVLGGARNLNRELYLVGDLQRTGWPSAVDAGLAAERGGGASPTAYLFFTEGPLGNLSVSSVSIARRYGGADGLYGVAAGIDNMSAREVEVPARLFVDGVQAGRAGVDLRPGESGLVQFSVSVDGRSWHYGRVEIPSDALELDNVRYFVIPPEGRVEVLLVGPDGESGGDAYYAERAIDPEGLGTRFRVSRIDVSSLPAQDPTRFPAVVLADVGRLSEDAVAWLESHVEGGGGLIVVLGDRTDVRFWNDGVVPGSSALRIVEPFERRAGVKLRPSGQGHPLLEGLAFGERLIDEINVRRGFSADGSAAEEVLELRGLGPGLVLSRSDEERAPGEVAVLMTGLDPEWSDLPRSGFVVPLMHRLVGHVAGGGSLSSRVKVGDDLVVPLQGGHAGPVSVVLPDGSTATPEQSGSPRPAAVLRRTELPGPYRFKRDEALLAVGVVNVDPREGRLDALSRADVSGRLSGIEHRFVNPGDDIEEYVLESRRGRELWRVFVYLALALLGLEMYLARQRA